MTRVMGVLFTATLLFVNTTSSVVFGAFFPAVYLEKLAGTPDLMQSLLEAGLPGHGAAYCAPVAVTNSLAWLQKNGVNVVAEIHEWTPRAQGDLAKLLGTPKYMHTTEEEGTGARGIMEGLSRYLAERGVGPFSLSYEGWDRHPARFSDGIKRPKLDWIKKSILGKSAVWLKVGWYRHDPKTDRYIRFAGHWVTLVGYGQDGMGRVDPDVLIIHDPAPRSGSSLSHDHLKLVALAHGRLSDSSGRTSIEARGFYRLSGELKIKDEADAGILDAAIALRFQ